MTVRRLLHPVALTVILAHLTLLALASWVLLHLVPDAVTLRAFGYVHLVSEVHRRVIDRATEIGVLLPAVFLFEYLWMGWGQSSVRHLLALQTASSRSDIACYLLESAPMSDAVSAIMTLGVVLLSGGWIRQHLVRSTGVDLNIAGAPKAVQIAVLFLLYTLFDYWSHRLDHSRLFWPLHRFHHSAQSFSVVTAARVHPAMFTSVVSATLPGILLGSERAALADVSLLIIVIRLVIHSRIQSNFGWVGRWIVQSPQHHRLHHSLNRVPINLGLMPIWDRLFGTWRDTHKEPTRIGTAEPYRHGVWVIPDMWRDYCEFWVGLRAFLIRRLSALRPASA